MAKRRLCAGQERLVGCRFGALAVVAVLALASGCGGGSADTAHLKGRITIDGQPIPDDAIGSITLQTTKPGQGKTVGAPLVEGRYELPEAPLGPLRVIIIVQQPTGRTIDNGRGTPAPEYQNIISDEYSSGIGVEVVGDKDDQDFDLKRS